MLTIIIFSILVILTYLLNLALWLDTLGFLYITIAMILSIILEIALNGLVATIVCKCLPKKWFTKGCKFFDVSKREQNFYIKVLKIKSWKDKNLELGALNGFRKNKFTESSNPEYIKTFILENNLGFTEHFVGLFIGSLLIFAYPKTIVWSMGLPTIIISFILNYMSIAILRYNTPRLKSALKFAQRKQLKEQSN